VTNSNESFVYQVGYRFTVSKVRFGLISSSLSLTSYLLCLRRRPIRQREQRQLNPLFALSPQSNPSSSQLANFQAPGLPVGHCISLLQRSCRACSDPARDSISILVGDPATREIYQRVIVHHTVVHPDRRILWGPKYMVSSLKRAWMVWPIPKHSWIWFGCLRIHLPFHTVGEERQAPRASTGYRVISVSKGG
jgi:hypothetical protein